jgi:hypothetical protein
MKVRPSQLVKLKFMQQEASKGNVLAKEYLEKLRKEEVSIDWAHRVLVNLIRQQRMLKMMSIADDRHFSYDNKIELVQKLNFKDIGTCRSFLLFGIYQVHLSC